MKWTDRLSRATVLVLLLLLLASAACSVPEPIQRAVGAITGNAATPAVPEDVRQAAQAIVDAAEPGGASPIPASLLELAGTVLEAPAGTYAPEVVAMADQVHTAWADGLPLPDELVTAARLVTGSTGEPGGTSWLDWIVLALTLYGGGAGLAQLTGPRSWSMLAAGVRALNPSTGPGPQPRVALNAFLAFLGARHSGDVLAALGDPPRVAAALTEAPRA